MRRSDSRVTGLGLPRAGDRKLAAVREAESAGQVADSIEVRKALIARMNTGELTLEEVQAELKTIQRSAKKSGQITRAQAYREG